MSRQTAKALGLTIPSALLLSPVGEAAPLTSRRPIVTPSGFANRPRAGRRLMVAAGH